MIDIHCHILFGLDDGSDNIEESVRMARIAVDSGIRAIIATPHSNVPNSYRNYWNDELTARLNDLTKRLEEEKLPLKIFPGHEIFASGDFIGLINEKKLLTLNGSVFPLVEFDFEEYSDSVYLKLKKLVANGFTPIVAHPERYSFVHEDDDAIRRIKNIGCLIQVNKGSLIGRFGKYSHRAAHAMMRRNMVDVIASDCHRPYMRTPIMEDVYMSLARKYPRQYLELLVEKNPGKICQDEPVLPFSAEREF